MYSDKIFGIDLGTTNSLIAVTEADRSVRIIANIPSVVHFSNSVAGQQAVVVGEEAEGFAGSFRSTKRLMGKGLRDFLLSKEKFSIFSDLIDFEKSTDSIIRLKGANKVSYTPVEIASKILQKLKEIAEKVLSCVVDRVVITVPAAFDDAARVATKDAAKIAGLEVIRIINEPTAAAMACGILDNDEGPFLIYDLGGGTFDVSILKYHRGVMRVIATKGCPYIGGDDFDSAILKIYPELLAEKCEMRYIKEKLSYEPYIQVGNTQIVREELENNLWGELAQITMKIVYKALIYANLGVNDIKKVILVGGATRMPIIQRVVEEFFQKGVIKHDNPEEIVAIGAAIQGCSLSEGKGKLLLDVTPLSLGLEVANGVVEVLIPRNTPVPVIATQTFRPQSVNVKIHILQGEGKLVNECRSLAVFELYCPYVDQDDKENIIDRIEVSFCIDANGILSVTAVDKITGAEQTLDVKPSYGLTHDEILNLIKANQ